MQAAGEHGAAGVDADDRRDRRSPGSSRRSRGRSAAAFACRSSCSSTTFSLTSLLPSWPHGTGLKDARESSSAEWRDPYGRRRHDCGEAPGRSAARLRTRSLGVPGSRGSVGDELRLAALGEGDLDQVEVAGGDGAVVRPPWPPRGPCRRGSGRRCGPGPASSRRPLWRPPRPGRRSSGRFRRRAGPPPRRSSRRGPAARRRAAASTVARQGAVSPVIDDVAAGTRLAHHLLGRTRRSSLDLSRRAAAPRRPGPPGRPAARRHRGRSGRVASPRRGRSRWRARCAPPGRRGPRHPRAQPRRRAPARPAPGRIRPCRRSGRAS